MFFFSLFCAAVAHEHLKDRALFSFPPPPPGANPSEYYHLMASASQRSPYGDLLMQNGAAAAAAAAAAAHLPDYISPVDGEDSASQTRQQNLTLFRFRSSADPEEFTEQIGWFSCQLVLDEADTESLISALRRRPNTETDVCRLLHRDRPVLSSAPPSNDSRAPDQNPSESRTVGSFRCLIRSFIQSNLPGLPRCEIRLHVD